MGLLMLGGLIGSILYGGYAFKMDAESEIIDSKVKPTTSEVENKKIIQQNFKLICKRGRIKLDNGLPINEKHYNPCLAYLEYRGFSEEEVNYFKTLYGYKYNMRRTILTKKISDKHKRFEDEWNNQENKKLMVYRKYLGGTEETMNTMMENDFWKSFTNHYSCVPDGRNNCEVWNLSVPEYIKEKDIDKIYTEVCFLQGIYKEGTGLKIQKI